MRCLPGKRPTCNGRLLNPTPLIAFTRPLKVLPQAFELLKDLFAALPKGSKMAVKDFPNGAYTVQGHFKYGYLGYNDDKEATEEQKDIVVGSLRNLAGSTSASSTFSDLRHRHGNPGSRLHSKKYAPSLCPCTAPAKCSWWPMPSMNN